MFSFMIREFIVIFIFPALAELIISRCIGIKRKRDLLTIIATNMLNSSLIYIIIEGLKSIEYINYRLFFGTKALLIYLLFKLLKILMDGLIYEKCLTYNNISGMVVSLYNNLIPVALTLIYGIYITILIGI